MSAYLIWKYLHVTGIIILVGNITVTAVWKVFADRTKNPAVVAFGQRMVTGTDIGLTLPGIALTMAGGYGAMIEAGYGFPGPGWLIWGQVCFFAAGLIWLGILIPIQIRQARMAEAFAPASGAPGGAIPGVYWRLSAAWLTWGLIATLPMVLALYFMIAKPVLD